MDFKRFSQLWDALVTNRPKSGSSAPYITNGMSAATARALIDYANGDKSKIEAVRTRLSTGAK